MSGGINLDFLEKCLELGVEGETVVGLGFLMERLPGGKDIVHACLDGMIAADRHDEAPEFFAKLVTSLENSDIVKRSYKRKGSDREVPEPSGYPVGPKERWGYDGPITPRLSERDWWPLRNGIVQAADSTCHYCGDQHDRMCADHVVPLSRGGTNEPDNLVCCCIPCNSSKADRLLTEWRGRYK